MLPDNDLLSGLPPILDTGIETLILGSFPSPVSLASQQYYGHRQNQFWRIMAAITGEPFPELDYSEKKRGLLRHHIGVWDVYRCCQRQGALDSAIMRAEPNDFTDLKTRTPRLLRVCFNGKTAGGFERRFLAAGYASCVLPSTSPAYTLSFERKLERWQAGLSGL